MTPNLFKIATSELSQDAFLAWLLAWADPTHKDADPKLNALAQDFVRDLMGKADDFQIQSVTSGRQWENIDVWAEVNKETAEQYLIIIEDKTHTGQHSNQLARYKETAANWCKENNFQEPVCIYLKTGSESIGNYGKIQQETGFRVLERKHLLDVFSKHPDVHNAIVDDFRVNTQELEASYTGFSSKPIKDWHGKDWVGFYQHLEGNLGRWMNWFYVNNPAGGFWCALLNWSYWGEYPVYPQIEQGRLAFKMCFEKSETGLEVNDSQNNVRQDEWQRLLIEKAHAAGFTQMRKPNRYVHRGRYRTVAVLDREHWLDKEGNIVDLPAVIERLNTIITLVEDVAATHKPINQPQPN